MRLLNLSLSNWRGVDSRDLALSDGVTLIEGPNEIGKSTLVEAVRMLFSERVGGSHDLDLSLGFRFETKQAGDSLDGNCAGVGRIERRRQRYFIRGGC